MRSAFGSNADDMTRSLFTQLLRFDLQRFAGLSDFVRDSSGAYLIQSANDLQNLAAYVNAANDTTGLTFKQTADIDLGSIANFTAIGTRTDAKQFKGTFDGAGFTINNLTINTSNSYQGLFGCTGSAAIVKNVNLKNINVSGGHITGGLVGEHYGTAENCSVTGKVNNAYNGTDNTYTGGLIATNYGTASACVADSVEITVNATGGTVSVGGIAGANGTQNGNTGSDCFAANISISTVTATECKGAVVGRVMASNNSHTVFGNFYNCGELAGLGQNQGTGSNETAELYKLTLPKGVSVSSGNVKEYGGAMYSNSELILTNTLASNLSCNDMTLTANEDGTYSCKLSADTAIGIVGATAIDGITYNSDGGFYEIASAADLQALSTYVNSGNDCAGLKFKQTADIDMSSVANFTAIGNSENVPFKGTFDGNGKTISNLTVTGTTNCSGLFGSIDSNAVIGNVILKNVSITNNCNTSENSMYAGCVVGWNKGGSIDNCKVDNAVVISNGSKNYRHVGGIVGSSDANTVSNCIVSNASITVTGSTAANYTGGIAGVIRSGLSVNGCIADNITLTGTASGSIYEGGIIGWNYGTIDGNCFARDISVSNTTGTRGILAGRNNNGTVNGKYHKDSSSTLAVVGSGSSNATQLFRLTLPKGVTATGNTIFEYDGVMYASGSVNLTSASTLATASGNLPGNNGVYNYNVSSDTTIGIAGSTIIDGLTYNADSGYYEIATAADLQALATYVNAGNSASGLTFKQTRDIDMKSVENFAGIGIDSSKPFAGTFDGGNFIISNLTVNGASDRYKGFVSFMSSSGTVRNVNLINANVTGYRVTACLVGESYGTISNCTVKDSSSTASCSGTGYNTYASGIVGYNCGTISGCVVDNVNLNSAGTGSTIALGGIAAFNSVSGVLSGSVDSDCLAINVSANSAIDTDSKGAVIGCITQTNSNTLKGCYYNCGSLAAVGRNDGPGTDNTELVSKLSLPDGVTSSNGITYDGALYAPSGTTLSLTSASGGVLSVDGTALSESMGNYSYTMTAASAELAIAAPSITGLNFVETGSNGDGYYEIATAADLQALASYVNEGNHQCYGLIFKQTADIDMSSIENFAGIGDRSDVYTFNGTFDGGNFKISNLTIDSSKSYQGMFGCTGSTATIENVNLVDANVTGGCFVGSLVGENYGTVKNCSITGNSSVTATTLHTDSNGAYAGGFVGMNYGKVNACIADSVAVSTTPASGTILAVGGIVGCNRRTTAAVDDDCFAVNVSVSAASGNEKGAIAGRIDNAGYTGGNFYDTGSLSGTGTGGDSTTKVCKLVVPTDVRIMGTDVIEYDDEMYAAGSVSLASTKALATASGNLSGSGGVYSYNMSADTTIGFSGAKIIDGLKYNSAGGYYEINSAADLKALSAFVNAGNNCAGLTFKQTRDIDMSTVENYIGIGMYQNNDSTKRFAGTFDGGNFIISNLSIDSTRNYEGLFSVVHSDGIIQNVNIVDANITCKMAGGGIVGDCHGTIKNCTVTGNNTITVTGTNESYAGGIAGYCYNTTELNISNCKVDGVKLSTAGTTKAEGGIVGVIWNYPAAIDSDCLAVNVTASEETGNMGAVVGWIQSGTAVVNGYYYDCGELGGVGNKNTGTDSTKKAYRLSVPFGISVASGTVFNGNGNTYASGDLTFTGSTNTGDLYKGTTKLTAASGTYSYTVTSDTILSEYPRIDGLIFNRAEGYFEITSAEDMQILADHVNAGNTCVGIKFKVMNDIDMSSIENFTAIGNATAAYQFQGEFDGDNYAISNLKIDKNAIDQGLFGYVGSDGIIENVKLVDATVKGQRDVGGIVGENNGTVRNCMAIGGTIENGYAHATANWAAAGGVVGWGRYGTIENCIADSVTVKSTFTADDETVKDVAVGGVVGVKSFSSTLGGNCLAISVTATVGDTTANGRVGAFLGQIYSNSTTGVEGYFYNYGNNSLAGLGKNSSSSTATVTQVYKFDLNGNDVEASGGITYNDAIYAASDTAISFSGTPSTGN